MSIFFENVDPSARIVGGTTAGLVPYMVSLTTGSFRSLLCGGSLISTRRVLTAAHCITTISSTLRGNVGSDRFASGGTSYAFSSRVIHPQYNGNTIKNDIGMLTTSTPVVLSSNVALISLNWNFIGGGVATRATGWGRISTNGAASQVLLRLDATTVDGNQCAARVAQRAPQVGILAPPVNPAVEICTYNSASRAMCRGDSGSPLVLAGTNQQIGIVSWGLPCARDAPDMFVRNSAFRSWVEQNM